MTEGEAAAAATNGQTKAEEGEGETQTQQQDVDAKIVKQIEYYFGDYNLPRDKFLQQEVSACSVLLLCYKTMQEWYPHPWA